MERLSPSSIILHCASRWIEVTTGKRFEIADPHLSKFQQLSVVKLLTQSVFARLHLELLRDQPAVCILDLVSNMCTVLVAWLFPPHLKSRRCNNAVSLLLCLFLIARGTLWLKRHYLTKIGQQVTKTLPGDLCHVFARPDSRIISAFLDLQEKALWAKSDDMGMYQWFSSHFRYTGIAKLSRRSCNQEGGPAMRLMEHLYNTVRPNAKEGKKLRYRMARRQPTESCCFILSRCGSETRIRALEWYDIKTHCPSANGICKAKKVRSRKPRQRPCKKERNQPDLTKAFNSLEAWYRVRKIERHTQHRHNRLEDNTHGRIPRCQALIPQAFHAAYLFCLRSMFAVSGLLGPVNIYDVQHAPLLARWLAKSDAVAEWARLEVSWARSFLGHALTKLAKSLPAPAQRRVVLKKVAAYLEMKGLPSKTILIKVVDRTCLHVVKQVVWQALDKADLSKAEKRWVKSKTRFAVSKTPVWKDKWTHAQHASQASLLQLVSMPAKTIADSLLGRGFVRPMLNWKLEFRLSELEKAFLICKEVRRCLVDCGLASVAKSLRPNDISDAMKSDSRFCAATKKENMSQKIYAKYTAPMKNMVGKGAVIPDDKLKHVAWGMPVVAYHVLCMVFLVLSTSWSLASLSPVEANGLLVTRLLGILGPKLARRFGIVSGVWLLPRGYVTIKSKCFAVGDKVGRACDKARHSCARKICSYSKWPKKLAWRRMNRAIDIVIKKVSPGAEVWGLDDAAQRLHKGLEKLKPSSSRNFCDRCSNVKPALVGVVADANQFYEEVVPHTAVEALGDILVKAASTGWRGVYVGKAKKRSGFLTADPPNPLSKFCFFDFHTLLLCFRAALAVPFVTFGHVVARMHGVPIGGLCSKAATSALLTSQEEAWFKRVSNKRNELGFSLGKSSYESSCLHLRYIDDVILASRRWCKNCLLVWLQSCYTVSFEACGAGDCLTWLDMVLDCTHGVVRPKHKEVIVPPPWGTHQGCLRPLFFNSLRRSCVVSSSVQAAKFRMMQVLLDFAKGFCCCFHHIPRAIP